MQTPQNSALDTTRHAAGRPTCVNASAQTALADVAPTTLQQWWWWCIRPGSDPADLG